jgi:hypothetical protein
MSEDDNLSDKDDRLIQRYDTILKESALLTTFSGILFGFILNISINTPRNFILIDIIVTIIALYSITIAASLFVMPVIYHHVQYPYGNWNKFKVRSHRFILSGLIPAGVTLYLGLELAIHSRLGSIESFILAFHSFFFICYSELERDKTNEFNLKTISSK